MSEYERKERSYFGHVRTDLVGLLPHLAEASVLEVGAGTGETLLHLKRSGLASRVVGLELTSLPDSNQKHPLLDEFHIVDVEAAMPHMPLRSFDIVLCGDVLEHLVDPWTMVRRLADLLKPSGYLLMSIPNFREIRTLLSIALRGDFCYSESGVLDKTHLRFFCRRNVVDLAKQASLTVLWVKDSLDVVPEEAGNRPFINKITLNLLREFWPIQYYVLAQKAR